jgi:phosphate transport system protein
MSRLLDVGLEQLTVMVNKMGEVAEKAVDVSIGGYVNGKDATANVRELSDILSAMTVEVENKAFELIVKYQPVASDLRIINSYMKIAYDFQRYGRYSWDISFTHKKVAGLEKCIDSSGLIQKLIETVSEMVSKSVQALKQNDGEMAKSLAESEKQADTLYFAYLDTLMKTTAQNKCVTCNLLVAHFLERIADHTIYVGEDIIYISSGEKINLG